jgi:hypothetical protein
MAVRTLNGWLRYGLPGLVVGALASSFGGSRAPVAVAQGGPGIDPGVNAGVRLPVDPSRGGIRPIATGETSGTMALLASSNVGSTQWLYMIDTKAHAFALYRIDPSNPKEKGIVKLEAARQYQWDLKLDHYNNQAPEPAAIEATVKSLAHTTR